MLHLSVLWFEAKFLQENSGEKSWQANMQNQDGDDGKLTEHQRISVFICVGIYFIVYVRTVR